jgi:hypothetical protein
MSTGVAVLGAGPYGLSAAAHLGRAGVETRVFGKTMAFWRERMPSGMLLRSGWQASHIADPARELTLDAYEAAQGRRLERPVPLTDFVNYGEWYRDRAGIEPDPRLVERLSRANGHFALRLDDGETVEAGSVVVATGLDRFEWRPPQFAALPSELVSHSSEHSSLAQFAGGRVAVVGSGQSATESAALLHEAGAEVELVLRRPEVQWLSGGRLGSRPRLHSLLYPPTDVGPPGLNWIVAAPGLFRTFPTSLRKPISTRVLRPAAAAQRRDTQRRPHDRDRTAERARLRTRPRRRSDTGGRPRAPRDRLPRRPAPPASPRERGRPDSPFRRLAGSAGRL